MKRSGIYAVFFASLLFVTIAPALADEENNNEDLVMYADQSAYYFKVGEENAIIPLEIENSSGQQVSGMLQYTITQQIRQGNTQISSTNTQASTFTVNDGTQTVSLDFGSASSPSTMIVNLNFSYNDDEGKETDVFLGPIEIHFVSDESQKNNTQNRMQSSSQQDLLLVCRTTSQISISPSNKDFDDLLNSQQPSPMQDPQQRLQNNQLAQDSTALKQEIQEQIQKENRLKQEFEKHIISNEEFQKHHQQLISEGYKVTQGSLNPISNSTGNFEVNYENSQGQWAKLEGSMENGTLTDIQKQTQEQRDHLLSKLRADLTFQKYEDELTNEGFSEQDLEFTYDNNITSISVTYQDQEMQNATIRAEFTDDMLTEINLERPRNNDGGLFFMATIRFGIVRCSRFGVFFEQKI